MGEHAFPLTGFVCKEAHVTIDQHDNASAHTARLTVNFQVANITFVLGRPPLSQDMSAIKLLIKLLIATLKSKGISI